MAKLTETPFTHVKRLSPAGFPKRTWIKEKIGDGYDFKVHSNASLLRLLNRQYREIESLKAQKPTKYEEQTNDK